MLTDAKSTLQYKVTHDLSQNDRFSDAQLRERMMPIRSACPPSALDLMRFIRSKKLQSHSTKINLQGASLFEQIHAKVADAAVCPDRVQKDVSRRQNRIRLAHADSKFRQCHRIELFGMPNPSYFR
jgi:hypothetical protein